MDLIKAGRDLSRRIPKTLKDYKFLKSLKVVQPENPKFLRVAVIGAPNCGKSTLTNKLIGWRVSAVSSRVHTTQANVRGVMVQDNVQIEFVDSPGLVTQKHCNEHRLDHFFVSHPKQSAQQADMICVVVDSSDKRHRLMLMPGLTEMLQRCNDKESILVINKTDILKNKRKLITVASTLTDGIVNGVKVFKMDPQKEPTMKSLKRKILWKTEQRLKENNVLINLEPFEPTKSEEIKSEFWPHFSNVFMVSALTGDGIDDLRDYFFGKAKTNKWVHHNSIITDENPVQLARNIIREKLLEYVKQEIPYSIKIVTEMWEVEEVGTLKISMHILCPKRHYVTCIIGPNGHTISKVSSESRQELCNAFHCDVSLKLIVKYYTPAFTNS